MARQTIKVAIAIVATLATSLLVWGIALADAPPALSGSGGMPASGKPYTYTTDGVNLSYATANDSEVYYQIAEPKYNLHNTRLEACALCHTQATIGGLVYISGMNSYGLSLTVALGLSPAAYGNGSIDLGAVDTGQINDAFTAIEGVDSDGENLSHGEGKNLFELNALSFPGDVNDVLTEVPSTLRSAGPHGQYGDTPDQCARCHRTHTAQAPKLLITDQENLCMSCHGGTTTTNVKDGVVDGGSTPLRAGGFVNATQNTNVSYTGPASMSTGPTTSAHRIGEVGTIWGNGARSATANAGKTGVTLECGSCHDPHMPTYQYTDGGTLYTQYRMLKGEPDASGQTNYVAIPDEAAINYTLVYSTGTGRPDTSYLVDRTSNFCASCHTRYMAGSVILDPADSHASTVGATDSGDAIFRYQHATKESTCSTSRCHSRPKCLDCHYAHGTLATMGTNSGGAAFVGGIDSATYNTAPWPDGTLTPNGNAGSRLLKANNRGVCTACHEK